MEAKSRQEPRASTRRNSCAEEIYFSMQKMEALRALCRALVSRTQAARAGGGVYLVSVGLLQHVVGTWTWAPMLVMRELLSIFARTYRVFPGKDPVAVVTLSAAVRDELMMAVDLAPAMLARLLPYSTVVSIFDASTPGYGIAVRILAHRIFSISWARRSKGTAPTLL